MKSKSLFFTSACLVLLNVACNKFNDTETIDPIHAGLADWTVTTHEKTDPNYDVVFPQDKVNTLEITMTTEEWAAIRADMTTLSGNDFGVGGNIQAGGAGQVGGGPVGGGMIPNGGVPPAGVNIDSLIIANGGLPGGGQNANNPPNGGAVGGGAVSIFASDPIYVPTSVKFNGKEWYKVGFRLKGNSSLSQSWRSGIYKLPFKMQFDEFEDKYPEITNQRFYGFKELSMSPAQGDASVMRDKVTADIFRAAGIPAANTAFYRVYINFGEGLKYCGVYTMVEIIDDTMVKNQFGEDKNNIYKPESTFQSFKEENFEKKNNKTEADYSDVKAMITALNATTRTSNPTQWRADLEKVFNVDHFLKYLAVNNTIVNWDAYGAMAHNHYLYNHPSKKLTWIPWDFNYSMTISNSSNTQTQQGGGANMRGVSLAMTEVTNSWPLIRYLADDATYYAKYKAYVKDFSNNVFTSAKMNAIFDKNYNLISSSVMEEVSPYSQLSNTASFTTAISDLKTHIITRNQAVATFLK
jgi:spore coat protein H